MRPTWNISSRASALWAKGGRGRALVLTLLVAGALVAAGAAAILKFASWSA